MPKLKKITPKYPKIPEIGAKITPKWAKNAQIKKFMVYSTIGTEVLHWIGK